MVYLEYLAAFEIGPEFIISGDTGSFVLHDLINCIILYISYLQDYFYHYLLNFGLLEFFGAF